MYVRQERKGKKANGAGRDERGERKSERVSEREAVPQQQDPSIVYPLMAK
jgi:hypothetical protein